MEDHCCGVGCPLTRSPTHASVYRPSACLRSRRASSDHVISSRRFNHPVGPSLRYPSVHSTVHYSLTFFEDRMPDVATTRGCSHTVCFGFGPVPTPLQPSGYLRAEPRDPCFDDFQRYKSEGSCRHAPTSGFRSQCGSGTGTKSSANWANFGEEDSRRQTHESNALLDTLSKSAALQKTSRKKS